MRRLFFKVAGDAGFLPLICLILLSGCAANKKPIQFSDQHMATLNQPSDDSASSSGTQETPKLSKQDLFKVDVSVYSYLLKRHFWDDGEYSAIFLQGPDDEVDALLKLFPHHIPPIKPSYRADLRPNRAPLDKDTGRPAMILSVDTLDPVGDTVQAIGKWYAGSAVTGFYSLNLRKMDGDWTIEDVR